MGTAIQMYMKLFNYKDKIRNLPNLQAAYNQIETLEAQGGIAPSIAPLFVFVNYLMILLTYKRFCPFSYIEGVIYRGAICTKKD